MRRRILHISFSIVYRNPRVQNAIKASSKTGCIVDVISLKGRESSTHLYKNGINYYFVPLKFLKFSVVINYIYRYGLFFFYCFSYILKYKHRYNIVHVHTMPDFLVFAALPAKIAGNKIIINFHDMFPELFSDRFKCRLLNKLWIFIERKAAEFADYIFCVHKPHLKLLKSRSIDSKKINYILNVPDQKLLPSLDTDKFKKKIITLVYAGCASYRFGLDIAVRGFEVLIRKGYDLKFKIFSGGENWENIKKLIGRLKLDDFIDYSEDFIPFKDVIEEINKADIGIACYRNTVFTNMISPLKIFEYSALKLPSVCPKLDVISSFFKEDSIYYFKAAEMEDFVRIVEKVISDAGIALNRAEKAYKVIEGLPWEKEEEKYIRVIEELQPQRKTMSNEQ